MLKSTLLIIMTAVTLMLSGCASSPEQSHSSDGVLWQQFQSDKAVQSLDK